MPMKYIQKIQADADALDDENQADRRQASGGETGSRSAAAGLSEVSQ